MKKMLMWAGMIAVGVALSGCVQYVKTYDAGGNLLGECTSSNTFLGIPLLGGHGGCSGSANPKDQK